MLKKQKKYKSQKTIKKYSMVLNKKAIILFIKSMLMYILKLFTFMKFNQNKKNHNGLNI
jgi:hypothetical protein